MGKRKRKATQKAKQKRAERRAAKKKKLEEEGWILRDAQMAAGAKKEYYAQQDASCT